MAPGTQSSKEHGQLDHDRWRVVNPSVTNAWGYNTSYMLESHDFQDPLLDG